MYKAILLLPAVLFSGSALAVNENHCDIGGDIAGQCPGPDYVVVMPPSDGNNCPSSSGTSSTSSNVVCQPPSLPPPPEFQRIDCYWDGYAGYNCEAWPQGEVTFTWASSGAVSVMDPGPTQNAEQYVSCTQGPRGGVVFVTITSPYGLSTSGSLQLSCRTQQEY